MAALSIDSGRRCRHQVGIREELEPAVGFDGLYSATLEIAVASNKDFMGENRRVGPYAVG